MCGFRSKLACLWPTIEKTQAYYENCPFAVNHESIMFYCPSPWLPCLSLRDKTIAGFSQLFTLNVGVLVFKMKIPPNSISPITCSSSSVRFSPSSFATRFKLSNEIFPVSSSSNSLNAFKISSFVSFSDILVDIRFRKFSNVKRPVLSLSTSWKFQTKNS